MPLYVPASLSLNFNILQPATRTNQIKYEVKIHTTTITLIYIKKKPNILKYSCSLVSQVNLIVFYLKRFKAKNYPSKIMIHQINIFLQILELFLNLSNNLYSCRGFLEFYL